ncbi:MAG: 2-phospho-L-lactate guanylyltransferase [Chloroflexi bacterium]|nr:2-phospho-L-lactate guanylyltransferase [Chloroflexota bacterium]
MNGTEVVAVVPMKPLAKAKTRLAACLTDEARQALSILLLERAVKTALASPLIAETWVLGGDGVVAQMARRLGAIWKDDEGRALNAALGETFSRAFQAGIQGAIYLPSDLAMVTPEDLTRVVQASRRLSCLVLAPALTDGGTNLVLMPRHLPITFRLAEGRSLGLHLSQAETLGYPVAMYASLSVGRDLDTEDDLRFFLQEDGSLADQLKERGIGLGPAFWADLRR